MPEINIPGPEGRLEARYQKGNQDNSPLCVVLHPHPRQGGTMNNKLVYRTYQAFKNSNFSTLRFNFRGVGRSQGVFDNGQGELSDAATALDWMQSYNPSAKICWIGGISFGAWVAMQLMMRRPDIFRFISVAPPANIHDFSFLAPCPASGLIVHGDKDTIVPIGSVEKLAQKLKKQKNIEIDFRVLKGGDHFLQEHCAELLGIFENYLDKALKS